MPPRNKYKLDYGMRLFLPMVGVLWFVILAVAIYQYRNESNLRKEMLIEDIRMLNARIISAYEQGYDIAPVIQFAAKYYENSALNGIRISVYDDKSNLIHCIGTPIPISADADRPPELMSSDAPSSGSFFRRAEIGSSHTFYYFGVRTSADRKIFVHTAMPYTNALSSRLSVDNSMWVIILMLAIGASVFAAITARILSRNVTLLYEFAHRAAAGEPMIADKEFPHDMLGDISRQIFKLYTEKDAAMARSEYDHAAAIKATEDKVRTTRELSNNINHELKTPVGVIRGYLDTIAEHPEMPPEMQKRFIANARQAMERLCNLLNDLSSITRLEEGGTSITREPVIINDLLYNMSTEIESTAILKHITFSYHIPDKCIVMCNYNLLYGMLMNLIVNADFHSRGDSCELKLLGKVDRRFYSFSFADNGIGVDEEHIPHLFERFYRIDKGRSRKIGGTGLGLPIVKNTVTVFGGDITVRNRTPHGLEFIFTLPIAD
jgi:signal transduction histidine kinase